MEIYQKRFKDLNFLNEHDEAIETDTTERQYKKLFENATLDAILKYVKQNHSAKQAYYIPKTKTFEFLTGRNASDKYTDQVMDFAYDLPDKFPSFRKEGYKFEINGDSNSTAVHKDIIRL